MKGEKKPEIDFLQSSRSGGPDNEHELGMISVITHGGGRAVTPTMKPARLC